MKKHVTIKPHPGRIIVKSLDEPGVPQAVSRSAFRSEIKQDDDRDTQVVEVLDVGEGVTDYIKKGTELIIVRGSGLSVKNAAEPMMIITEGCVLGRLL